MVDRTTLQTYRQVNHLAGMTAHGQSHWPAADRTVFDECLIGLRRVDLERKPFSAMRTTHLSFDRKFHRIVLDRYARFRGRFQLLGLTSRFLAEVQLANATAVRLSYRHYVVTDAHLFTLSRQMA